LAALDGLKESLEAFQDGLKAGRARKPTHRRKKPLPSFRTLILIVSPKGKKFSCKKQT